MSVICIAFTTLDGVITDPTGSDGTPLGGWALRHGPEAIAGDRFRLGPILEDGVLLFGGVTWRLFAGLWPNRTGPFAAQMNAATKLVASSTLTGADLATWSNSQLLEGDLVDAVKREERDVVVMGSLSVAHKLMAEDMIDEYRLITFPTVLGTGERLFLAGGPQAEFTCTNAEPIGPAVFTTYRREAARS